MYNKFLSIPTDIDEWKMMMSHKRDCSQSYLKVGIDT